MSKHSLYRIVVVPILVLLLATTTCFAQPDPPDPPGPPDNPPRRPVPISGLGYLLVLGGAIGVKRIYDITKGKNLE